MRLPRGSSGRSHEAPQGLLWEVTRGSPGAPLGGHARLLRGSSGRSREAPQGLLWEVTRGSSGAPLGGHTRLLWEVT